MISITISLLYCTVIFTNFTFSVTGNITLSRSTNTSRIMIIFWQTSISYSQLGKTVKIIFSPYKLSWQNIWEKNTLAMDFSIHWCCSFTSSNIQPHAKRWHGIVWEIWNYCSCTCFQTYGSLILLMFLDVSLHLNRVWWDTHL